MNTENNTTWASFSLPDETGTIPSLIEQAALKFPERKALEFFGFSMTYKKLWQSVQRFSCALQNTGVCEKERVVLFLPNCPHFIIGYYATLRAGAAVVPTNPLYGEKELEFQINDSGAETLITLDILFPKLQKVLRKTKLKRIVVGKIQDFLPVLKRFIYPILPKKGTDNVHIEEKNGVIFFSSLMKSKPTSLQPPPVKSSDMAMLQYTGGTTGLAKGAMLSHRNIVANNIQMRQWYSKIREAEETFIAVLPFFHSYGSSVAMNLPLSAGATLIIFPQFKAKDILRAIKKYRATVLPGIPSIYSVLNSFRGIEKHDISTINYCISGAAPLPVSTLEEFENRTGGMIIEGYGLSEASPVTHANPMDGKREIGSIGLPLPFTECKIVDTETGEELPQGKQGELCIRGPQVMSGYWQQKDETRQTIRNGWLYTGDIARMDESGYFYIVERKKDMIISEGFNVYPREIEEFLLKHSNITDAAVIGIPDRLRGEKVIVYVVLKHKGETTSEEVIKYCRDNLVKYKVPRKVVFADEIPTNIAGKKLRRVIRETESASEGNKQAQR